MIEQQNDSIKFIRYACEYEYQGHKWAAYIDATSIENAEARLRCLGRGKVLGELICTIPVPTSEPFINKLITWFKKTTQANINA
jgi:hypothetical protein